MTVQHVEGRSGAYADSVTLMQVSQRAASTDGIAAWLCSTAWGSPDRNRSERTTCWFALRTRDDDALPAGLAVVADALGVVAKALAARPEAGGGSFAVRPPRTVSSAARLTGPALTLISLPGQHAFTEAMDALDSGCDVMIFSDNVPVELEIRLKDTAAERGLLVLGPDCGTAVIGGVGLGFSHTLSPSPIGLVAASGTGAQQILRLLDAAGAGVSAATRRRRPRPVRSRRRPVDPGSPSRPRRRPGD